MPLSGLFKRKLFRLPTWLLVATGLVLNILAALTTHFLIYEKQALINQKQMQLSNNEQQIDLAWQQITGLERKREVLLLMLATDNIKPESEQILLHSLTAWGLKITQLSRQNLAEINHNIDQVQKADRTKIDDTYLANLSLHETIQATSSQVTGLKSLALFLQIIGLALILARDLSRKPG